MAHSLRLALGKRWLGGSSGNGCALLPGCMLIGHEVMARHCLRLLQHSEALMQLNLIARVGGAAGTIAKSISAYDMSISDSMYGACAR